MFRSTVIVASLNLLSIFIAFFVNVIISAKFGSSSSMDAYSSAIAIPNYILVLFTGILGYTFLPFFTKYESSNPNEVWVVTNSFISIVFISTLLFVLIGIVISKPLFNLFLIGFDKQKINFTISLFIIYLPIIIFTSLNELLASILYSKGNFLEPLLNKLISPTLVIVFVLLFSKSISVKSIIYASLLASFIQFVLLWLLLVKKLKFKFKLSFDFSHPEVKLLGKLMMPLIVASIFYKLFPVFDIMILSNFPVGTISTMAYANKLQLAFASIVTSIFSIQIFSLFSQLSAKGEMAKLKTHISVIIKMLFFISIPFSVIAYSFTEVIIKTIYEHGTFLPSDTKIVAAYFKIYIIALPAIAIGGVISQGLYSMQQTKAVMFLGFVEAVFYPLLCLILKKYFGSNAIPLAYISNFYFSTLILAFILRNKINLGGGYSILIIVLKLFLVSSSIFLAIKLVYEKLQISVISLGFILIFGLFLYYQISNYLNIAETKLINEKFKKLFLFSKK